MPILSGNTWDLILLAIAAYVAVTSLVRLMLAERDRMARELDQQVQVERARLAAEKRAAEKEARKKVLQEEYDRQRRKTA